MVFFLGKGLSWKRTGQHLPEDKYRTRLKEMSALKRFQGKEYSNLPDSYCVLVLRGKTEHGAGEVGSAEDIGAVRDLRYG